MYIEDKIGNHDYSKGAEWLHQSAEQEYRDAQYDLGTLYEQGKGVKQDSLRMD